MIRINQK